MDHQISSVTAVEFESNKENHNLLTSKGQVFASILMNVLALVFYFFLTFKKNVAGQENPVPGTALQAEPNAGVCPARES